MRRMKPETKKFIVRIVAILLVLLFILSIALQFVFADTINSDVVIEAQVGFDGYVKDNCINPVNITVTNNSKSFEGEIRFEGGSIDYCQELEFPESSTKNITLYPVIGRNYDEYAVCVYDKKGRLISENKKLNMKFNDDMWVGAIGENLNMFEPSILRIDGKLFYIDKDNINFNVIDNFDVIVINDYNISSELMNELILRAEGGMRIITDKNAPDELKKLANTTVFDKEFDAAFLSGDMTAIMAVQSVYDNYSSSSYSKPDIKYFSSRLPLYEDTGISIISLLIIIYIVFIGPVLFLMLKIRDKKEKAIIVIPALSAVMVVLIYVISLGGAYKRPIVNEAAYYDIDTQRAYTSMDILSPDKGNINIEYNRDIDVYAVSADTSGNISEKAYPNAIRLENAPKWTKTYALYCENIQTGKFDMQLETDGVYIYGKITNNTGYDLEDVCLASRENQVRIGDIKNSESVDVARLNGIKITDSSVQENAISDYASLDLTREEFIKEYSKFSRQDMLDKICGDFIAGESIKLTAFSDEEIHENTIRVNGKRSNYTVSSVFVQNADLSSLSDGFGGVFAAADFYSISENAQTADEGGGYIYGEDGLPITIEYRINEQSDLFALYYNSGYYSLSIYNDKNQAWEDVNAEEFSSDYIGTGGTVKLKITDYEVYQTLPLPTVLEQERGEE